MGQVCLSSPNETKEDSVKTTVKQVFRPKRVILCRHGQSEGNANRKITMTVPDHMLHLTQAGREQALETGRNLFSIIGKESVTFFASPYVRACETMNGIAQSFGGVDKVNVHEDAYIREQDFGNFDRENTKEMHKEKKVFGKFYYRFPEGESPADVYNRAGLFLEGLYRRWETKFVENYVIVSHELFIIVFLMRMFRFPISDYYRFEDMGNCQLTVLDRGDTSNYKIAYTWTPGQDKKPGSLPMKPPEESSGPVTTIWDGRPESEMLHSVSRKAPNDAEAK